jgi:hypothetical protein
VIGGSLVPRHSHRDVLVVGRARNGITVAALGEQINARPVDQALSVLPTESGAVEFRLAAAGRALHLEHVLGPDLEVISAPAGTQYRTRKCRVVDAVLDQ